MERANHSYYRDKVGRWRSPIDFSITDWAEFRRVKLGALDRARAWSMFVAQRVACRLWLHTSVEYDAARGSVLHTTRVMKWGLTFFDSRETFTLAEDGRRVAIHMEQRLAPLWWKVLKQGPAEGVVDEDGECARYSFVWLGCAMVQTTRPTPTGLSLVQTTSWSRLSTVLTRT